MLHSSCWAQGSLQISAHQSPQHAPSPLWASEDSCSVCLSVGSLYYQHAAHMPAGLQLGPTQLCCSACFLITSVFVAVSCVVVANDQSFCSICLSTFSKPLGFVLLQPKHEFSHDCSQPDWYARLLVAVKWYMKTGLTTESCLRVFYFQSEALKTSLKKEVNCSVNI